MLNERTLPPVAISLWLGELAASRWMARPGVAWWIPLVGGLALLAWSAWGGGARPGARTAALLVAAVAIGSGWAGGFLARTLASPLADAGSGTITGTLRTDPVAREGGWSAIVGVDRLRTDEGVVALRGGVWVGGRGDVPTAVRGDRVSLSGAIGFPEDRGDPGFARFLLSRGLSASVRASSFERLGPASNPFIRLSQVVRGAVGGSIARLFPEREAGLLLGLALGDGSRLLPATERDFRATGLSHLLVVSGGNVAMVLAPIVLLLSRLPVGRTARFVVPLVLVVFFVVLTGVEASVVRAGVMAGLALLGAWLGRPRDGITLLAAATAVLLVVDPALALSLGFQLSVGATGGMVLLATTISERLAWMPRSLAVGLGATLAAQAFVSPLLLAVFREIPLSSIPANVLAAPAVSPALLLGLAASAIGGPLPPLGPPLAKLAMLPMTWLMGVADRLARSPLPWITSGGGTTVLVVGIGVVAIAASWLRSRGGGPRGGGAPPPPRRRTSLSASSTSARAMPRSSPRPAEQPCSSMQDPIRSSPPTCSRASGSGASTC